jgi:hypothetical protein
LRPRERLLRAAKVGRSAECLAGEGRVLHLVGPGEGSRISALGSTYTTKTDGEVTGGAYSLVEEELWGDPTPLHVHTREEDPLLKG